MSGLVDIPLFFFCVCVFAFSARNTLSAPVSVKYATAKRGAESAFPSGRIPRRASHAATTASLHYATATVECLSANTAQNVNRCDEGKDDFRSSLDINL